MTREEAIQHLENIIIFSYQDDYNDEAREALKMAIEALKGENEQMIIFNGRTPKKEFLLEELAKEDLQVLSLAYMYAKNLQMYDEDVTKAISTATENAIILNKAYRKGYYDAMKKIKQPSFVINADGTIHQINNGNCDDCVLRTGKTEGKNE